VFGGVGQMFGEQMSHIFSRRGSRRRLSRRSAGLFSHLARRCCVAIFGGGGGHATSGTWACRDAAATLARTRVALAGIVSQWGIGIAAMWWVDAPTVQWTRFRRLR